MSLDELEELKKAYQAELPAKASAIAKAVHAVVHELGAKGKADFAALEHLTHKLAGSSGTYGFPVLSIVNRHLEDLIFEKKLQALSPQATASYLNEWLKLFAAYAADAARGETTDPATVGIEATLRALFARFEGERKAA